MLERRIARYGHDWLVRGLNGLGFHPLQSRKISGFGTPQRKAEWQAAVAALVADRFGPGTGAAR